MSPFPPVVSVSVSPAASESALSARRNRTEPSAGIEPSALGSPYARIGYTTGLAETVEPLGYLARMTARVTPGPALTQWNDGSSIADGLRWSVAACAAVASSLATTHEPLALAAYTTSPPAPITLPALISPIAMRHPRKTRTVRKTPPGREARQRAKR